MEEKVEEEKVEEKIKKQEEGEDGRGEEDLFDLFRLLNVPATG